MVSEYDFNFTDQPLSMFELQAYLNDGDDVLRMIYNQSKLLTPSQVRKTLDYIGVFIKSNTEAKVGNHPKT